jgi:hypothetical protein
LYQKLPIKQNMEHVIEIYNCNKQTLIHEFNAGSTAIDLGSVLDNVLLDACHGSGNKAEGFIKADSIPFPSISNNNLACISRIIALAS